MNREHGQSMVELALTIPILLLLLAGMVEVGWYFNVQLNFLDASREGGRLAADGSLINYHANHNHNSPAYDGSDIDCKGSLDIYELTACATMGNMQNTFVRKNSGWDDIVISIYKTENGKVTQALPADSGGSWSLTGAQHGKITPEYIAQYATASSPGECLAMGWIVIEVYYVHKQFLGLLAFGNFVPEYSAGYVFSIFPMNALGTKCD